MSVAAGLTRTDRITPATPDRPVVADRARPRRGAPAYLVCFLAFIPANMFSGYSGRLGFPIGPDRLLFAAGLVLLLLDVRPWTQVRLRWRAAHTAMLMFATVVALSAFLTGSWRAPIALYGWLDVIVVPFVLFAVAPAVFADARSRDLLIKVLVVIALYLGLTAIFEMVGPTALVWPRYILDPSVGIQFGRARGPFAESEANGMTMAMAGFVAGLGVVRFRGTWRLLSEVACGLAAVGVVLALTRSVWIGATVALLGVFLLVRALRPYLPVVLVGGAIALLALLAYVPGLSDSVSGRADAQGPVFDRLNTNAAGLRIVEQKPLTGIGWYHFINEAPSWVRQAPTYPITAINIPIHNVFLSRAAELGLPAAALFVVCLGLGPIAAVFRRGPRGDLLGWRAVSFGILLVWLAPAMASPLTYPLPNALLWLVAGLASTGYISGAARSRPLAPGGEVMGIPVS